MGPCRAPGFRPSDATSCLLFLNLALIWISTTTALSPMSALSTFRPAPPNRRRRVRHKIQTPAYASFTAESESSMLDLYEIIDISEDGAAIQCSALFEVGKQVSLCMDLAECPDHIYTSGRVVWSSASGRIGLHFSELRPASLFRLREWLFLNAMAGVANAEAGVTATEHVPALPSYSDTLAAVTAVQREAEALGGDLSAALQLIAERAQSLLRASGSAIALATNDSDIMECRASSGPDAPPIGARLQVGSGFSGECVKTGRLLRCDDAELDPRVDRELCRALGLRSILAAPVRVGERSVGILEAFSPTRNAFTENDERVLDRLAGTVLAAVNRAARAESLPELVAEPPADRFAPSPGSVLFASADSEAEKPSPEKSSGGISLPRSLLVILYCIAGAIFLALGYLLAPAIQSKLEKNKPTQLQTVLASNQAPKTESQPAAPSVETATLDQLRQMAENGDAAAQNSLGLRYATGDGVTQNEMEAVRWLTKSAEQGNVSAQSKLGALYLRGRDIQQDLNRAYFWMVLARASGDQTSKVLAPTITARLSRQQQTAIELDADRWLREHEPAPKPSAGR